MATTVVILHTPSSSYLSVTHPISSPEVFRRNVPASASPLAFYALCAADPMAWIAADAVLCVPLIRNIMRMDYRYLRSGQI